MLEDAGDVVAGDVVDGLRVVVEGGDEGEDGGSCFGGGGHVADMDEVEGGLADAEDEGAVFLEANVGGALDEVLGEAVTDAGEGAHGAGQHDHAVAGVGTAGDGSADVFVGELRDLGGALAEQLFHKGVAAADGGLLREDAESAGADDEVDAGDTGVCVEGAKHFAGEEDAAGPGDGEGEIFFVAGCKLHLRRLSRKDFARF